MNLVEDIGLVRWPKDGKKRGQPCHRMSNFIKECRKYKNEITNGIFFAFDPGSGYSSNPGYAIREGGILIEAGVIDIPSHLPVEVRLRQLGKCLDKFGEADIICIEHLDGVMVRPALHWSSGAIISHTKSKYFIECPIPMWHAVAKVSDIYYKDVTDDEAAILMNHTCFLLSTSTGELK